jgi:hypothetical protein
MHSAQKVVIVHDDNLLSSSSHAAFLSNAYVSGYELIEIPLILLPLFTIYNASHFSSYIYTYLLTILLILSATFKCRRLHVYHYDDIRQLITRANATQDYLSRLAATRPA